MVTAKDPAHNCAAYILVGFARNARLTLEQRTDTEVGNAERVGYNFIMKRTKQAAVRRYHDRVAGSYDHSYEDEFWQWHDALTWDYLRPYLPRNANAPVADLGCGTGKWAAKLAKSGYPVTCVDISPRMLDQARAKLASVTSSARVQFVQADLCDMGQLPAQKFQLAVAMGDPICCTRSPEEALREIRRVLAPGGILVGTFDNRYAAIDYYLGQGDAKALSGFLRDGRTNWLTKCADERFGITTFAPGDIHKLVGRAGFELMTMVGKTVLPMRHYRHLLATAEARRAWAGIEKSLAKQADAIGRASHIQVTCRCPP